MSAVNIYVFLIAIFIVTLSIEQVVSCSGKTKDQANRVVKSIAKIKEEVEAICEDVENLPEKVCGTVINPIKDIVEKKCGQIPDYLCEDALPWTLRILVPEGTCKELVADIVECAFVTRVIDFAEDECVEELEKLVMTPSCDADGNEVDLCDGLPDTVDGICTVVVDKICEEMPELLHPFVPLCQKFLDTLLCELV